MTLTPRERDALDRHITGNWGEAQFDDEECDCEYPHLSDYDPYNFERCDCAEGCWHFGSLEEVEELLKESDE